jgi:hypothetical protein
MLRECEAFPQSKDPYASNAFGPAGSLLHQVRTHPPLKLPNPPPSLPSLPNPRAFPFTPKGLHSKL